MAVLTKYLCDGCKNELTEENTVHLRIPVSQSFYMPDGPTIEETNIDLCTKCMSLGFNTFVTTQSFDKNSELIKLLVRRK